MFILYNLAFLIFAIIWLPVYLFRGKFHKGFSARLGKLPANLNLDRPIWIHAVSVGEAASVAGLAEELRRLYPDKKFVISTVTATGNKIAKRIAKEGDLVTYLPLDLSWIVRSTIDRINPSIFIIAETEIWPNLIRYLRKKNIPVITVNGRISDKSFKGYLGIKLLIKPVLEKVSLFCVQSERDAERFKALGVAAEKVKVTGNMKFDIFGKVTVESGQDYRSMLRIKTDEKLLVAASTHPKEERIILDVYKELSTKFSGLRLLIAPRHPERAHEIFGLIKRSGFNSARISRIIREPPKDRRTIFILDTIGQLLNFYSICDIVFVGGSLIKKGGHNILEPAALARPVIFGPNMFNFRDITELFLLNRAAIMVHNDLELTENIEGLLKDPAKAKELGEAGRRLIQQNQGATLKNAHEISLLFT
jgi:3-deoxy-D-manno-octulosonic-acid transferase